MKCYFRYSFILTLFFSLNFILAQNGDKNNYSEELEKTNLDVLGDLMQTSEWNTYFPYRWGYDINTMTRTDDFYTYEKFKEAIEAISKYELLIERRCGTNQVKITHTNTETGVAKVVSTSTHFNASWNLTKPLIKDKVFYKNFLAEGTVTTRKRELAAFLANISHETTGGPIDGNTYEWGLFFREEGENTAEPPNDYVSPNEEYPPVAGKSYHGRGPIQLSYNYNYGLASEHIFGDKSILLNTPELVSTDAKISLMTAVWFWMTPQSPKPSAHDVMVGNWMPTQDEIALNRLPGLGMTINIINGGVECGTNSDSEKLQVQDRINYYKRYASILSVSTDIDGGNNCDTCGCTTMANYANGGVQEPCSLDEIPHISIEDIAGEPLINNPMFNSINIKTTYPTDKGQISNFQLKIDEEVYTSTNLSWTPKFFKSYTLEASVNINNTPYDDRKIITIYDNTNAIDCTHIPTWVQQDYTGNSIVEYNGDIYKAKYYTSTEPTTNNDWEMIGSCLNNLAPTLLLTTQDLGGTFEIKSDASDDTGLFFVDYYVDSELEESFNPRATNTDLILTNKHSFNFTPTSLGTYAIKVIAFDKYGASTTKSESIIVTTLGVYDIENKNTDVQVYPNPVSGIVSIKTKEGVRIRAMKVFSVLGKKLAHSSNVNSLNLSHLPKGFYTIEIQTEATKIYKKIIKN